MPCSVIFSAPSPIITLVSQAVSPFVLKLSKDSLSRTTLSAEGTSFC